MIRKTSWSLLVTAIAALALSGCGGSSADDETEGAAELIYNPVGGAVPSPNDLGFQGSQDGTVNATEVIPTGDTEPLDSQVSINSQDGFSTIASSTASFTVPVDADTVVPGDTVRVFEVTTDPATKAVTGLVGELAAGSQYVASLSSADRNGRTLAVTPLAPLNPSSSYLVAVTDGVEAEGGGAIGASQQYALVKSGSPLFDGSSSLVEGFSDGEAETLEGVRQLTQSYLAITSGAGIATEDLIATWSFSTQSIGDVLTATNGLLGGASITAPAFAPTGTDTPQGAADIWVGRLSGVPYYLEAPSQADPTAPLTGFWEAATEVAGERNLTGMNPVPLEKGTVDLPVVLAIPKTGCPCGVVIFQHGITTNRKSALAVADALAGAGFATIGIDLPLHGITDTSDPLYAGDENAALAAVYGGNIERTFDLDLIDNDTGEEGADGEIDPSGEHFINLPSLRTSRDNLRQAVVDLLALESALGTIETTVDGAAGEDVLDPGTVHFVGQSLGAIVGVPYLANSGAVGNAVLAAPGGGIAKLLDGSPTIGPEIAAGLAENELVKGQSGYEQFLGAAQTLVDSADPLNYATTAVGSVDVLAFEFVGGNSTPPDQVVPNNVVEPFQAGVPDGTVPSPTAGTDPLATVMGLTQVGAAGGGSPALVRLVAGEHSSLVNPDPDPAVTTELQTIMAAFIDGFGVVITDGSLVEEP